MKRKIVAVIMAAAMAVSMAACGSSSTTESSSNDTAAAVETEKEEADAGTAEEADATSDTAVTLVYAEVNPEDSLMGQTAAAFKEKVEELSGGSVTVDVQYSGVLGAEGDVLDSMLGGAETVDVARISTASIVSYGAGMQTLLSTPYLFEDRDHFWAFANSDLGQEVLDELENNSLGVRGLFYAEEGFRNFFFKDEIAGIEDLAGKKIRVSTDPIMTGMVDGLGASATVVAFTELYSSLSSGVCDGAEQPIANYQSNAFYEVAPYMILDRHTIGSAEVIISDAAWAKLSESQQEAVMEASKYASETNASLSEQIENECIDQLTEAGVTFIEVDDLSVWQDACAATIAENIKGYEEQYQAILDMK